MKRRQKHEQNYVLILAILAFGTTVLYSFTLMDGVTGLATGDTPPECQNYAKPDDPFCDDDKPVCADKYVEGTSLVACHECTTGPWKQSTWCKFGSTQSGPPTTTTTPSVTGVPSQCEDYASENDPYCDDDFAVCNPNKYVDATSLPACHECTTGVYKQAKWCKGQGQTTTTTTVPPKPLGSDKGFVGTYVEPGEYVIGETVKIYFSNSAAVKMYLGNLTIWAVNVTPNGGWKFVLNPEIAMEIPPKSSKLVYQWNQKDYGGNQVKAGTYEARISYSGGSSGAWFIIKEPQKTEDVCGNGICESSETETSCFADCALFII